MVFFNLKTWMNLVSQKKVHVILHKRGWYLFVFVFPTNEKLISSVQSSQSLWSRLSVLLNFLPHENDLVQHGENFITFLPYFRLYWMFSILLAVK